MQTINYLTSSSTTDKDGRSWSPEEDVCSDNETPMINYGDILIRQIKKDDTKLLRFDNCTTQKRIRKIIDFGQATDARGSIIRRETNSSGKGHSSQIGKSADGRKCEIKV